MPGPSAHDWITCSLRELPTMSLNQQDRRLAELLAARERAAERRAHSAAELEAALRELAKLIHSIDPIRRCVVWAAERIENIAARQDWKCPQCNRLLPPLSAGQHHVDHIVPWILGGG